ncbi:MAG: bifunctional 4-hydroxy-2-oxoglutarate aldolase/2-dehydro-3-deoxy-phosphogluconate aldolase [Prochlorococcus sp.]|nr:bifunctional 4-hydroxy-2-oxoglutarate aldolase/2-dehydro-3-deoxy-phosphogluconate aldolase [Prochlorococcaceae cyanobacterium ETNP18_MAG_1]
MASLSSQPLIVVLRPELEDLAPSRNSPPLLAVLEQLQLVGLRHVELAWSAHPGWMSLMREVKAAFSDFSLGAASIHRVEALHAVKELGLSYAMTPCFDLSLQNQALELQQLLVPGVFSPSEIHQACSIGCQLVKLFPASVLGMNYWRQIEAPLEPLPFVIAAGGLTVSDLTPWLAAGYNSVALGRGLIKQGRLDPALNAWLKDPTSNI